MLQEAKCGYAIILMALYWCTECIPLAATALLPVILFPLMGIMEASEVDHDPYLQNLTFISVGSPLQLIYVHYQLDLDTCYLRSPREIFSLRLTYLWFSNYTYTEHTVKREVNTHKFGVLASWWDSGSVKEPG